MIRAVSNIQALSFMSLFPEMRDPGHWDKVVKWVGSGKKIPFFALGVFDKNKMVGLFPINTDTGELMIHACFLKGYRGDFARKAAKEAFQWIWKNTEHTRIVAYIEPEHVKTYAMECGMIDIGGLFEVTR